MAETKKYTFGFPVASIFFLFAILVNSAIANFKSTPLQLQGVWEFDEYYAFDPETNRYERHKEWGGMGGLPYIAFSGEYVCPSGTMFGRSLDPCGTGFYQFTIEKNLITIERPGKSPLIWRFILKNKKLEINELSVEPILGTQEHKLKFIYKKSDLEPNLSNFLPREEELLLAPTKISNVKISDITAYGATITWTTDQPATSDIDYRVSKNGRSMAGSQELVTEHSVTLGNLDGDKDYSFFVQSCNNGGCITNESKNLSFTTLARKSQLQKIVCENGVLTVPSDRWLIFLRNTPESVIAEFFEFSITDKAFEITLRDFERGEIDFSYRIFSPDGKEIKTGPILKFSLRPDIVQPSWIALINPYYISDIAAKTNRGGFYDYNILWKGEKLPDSKVELSCNGQPFSGTGKILTEYELNKLPWKQRLQGAWQLKKEAKAERISSGDFIIHPYKEASEVEYIIFKNNKICFDEYPCPKEKFFPFSVSKQTQRNKVTPTEVTLMIKTPLRKLRWGFGIKQNSSVEEAFLTINKDEYTSQIFERIEEALLESAPAQSIPPAPSSFSLPTPSFVPPAPVPKPLP